MKKIKFIFMISFVCLLSVLGIYTLITGKTFVSATSENEKPKLEIYKNNVSYSSEIFLAYAVTYENMDAKDYEVQLLFWTELKDEYVKGTESYVAVPKNYQKIDKKNCIVFYSYGLAAKQMTEDIYSRAYVKIGNQEYYSEVDKFSILDYAHRMLEGGTLNPHQEKLLKNLLNYGGAAQDNFGHNTDKPADATYYSIVINDGTLEDGFNHGRYQYGEKLVIKPNEKNGYKFSHWTNEYGIVVSYDKEFEVIINGNKEFTANYKDISQVASQLQLEATIAYDRSIDDVDLPKYVSFEYNGEKVTLEVVWNVESFIGSEIGKQKIYATLVDESAYAKYDIDKEDIYIEVTTSAYTFEVDQNTGEYIITGYYGNEEKVVIPSTYNNVMVTSIASKAFYENMYIKELIIPTTITKIAKGAIWYCDNIETLEIPFTGESIDSNNSWLGYIFGAAEYQTHTNYIPLKLTKVSLPKGATKISHYAFYNCDKLQEIYIPTTLEEIGREAFSGCTALTEFTINSQLKKIYDGAFYNCINLKKVYVDSLNTLFNVNVFGNSPLCNGAELYVNNQLVTEIIIPNNIDSLSSILSGCSSITKITIPNNIVSIQWGAFGSMENLEKVIFEEESKLTSIETSLFYGCISLTNITIPDSVTAIGHSAFSGCISLTNITIPDSVTAIDNSAFSGCQSLENIKLPKNLESLGSNAFSNCYSLKSIEIPIGIASINSYTFYDCYSLEDVVLPESLVSIEMGAFYGCKQLSTITIPSRCRNIGDSAFSDCDKLYEVYNNSDLMVFVPGSTDYGYIAYNALKVVNNEEVIYKENIEKYEYTTTEDGFTFLTVNNEHYLISYSGTDEIPVLPYMFNGEKFSFKYMDSSLNVLKLSSDYIEIESNFFEDSEIKKIYIPKETTMIGDQAFINCTILKEVIFEEGSSLQVIGGNAFHNCISLTNIELPNGVLTIGYDAFSYCSSLKSITIPNSVISIASSVFFNCYNLKDVIFEENSKLQTLEGNVFNWCDNLLSVEIPSSIKNLNHSAFNGLKNVYYSGTINQFLSISMDYRYEGDSYILTVDSIYVKDENGEYYSIKNSGLIDGNNVVLNNGVHKIGSYMFQDFDNLETVYFDGTLDEWLSIDFENEYSNPMYYAENLYYRDSEGQWTQFNDTTLVIPESCNLSIYSLYGLNTLDTIINLSGQFISVEGLNDYYEYDVDANKTLVLSRYVGNSTNLIIPSDINGSTVGSIGQRAFSSCFTLESITIPSSVISIGSYAFYKCTSLTNITFEEGIQLTSIGEYAFAHSGIKEIMLSKSVNTIYQNAFSSCETLEKVYYDGTVEEWCNIYFVSDRSNPLCYANEFYIKEDSEWILLNELVIPTTITTIKTTMFSGYDNFEKIIIPQSVNYIEEFAFGGNNTIVYCEISSQPSSWEISWAAYLNSENIYWGVSSDFCIKNNKYLFSGNEMILEIFNKTEYQDPTYIISSSNLEIAQVLENGNIKVLKEGTFTVTIEIENTNIMTSKEFVALVNIEDAVLVDGINVTFGDAINNAIEGTTIYVLPGLYDDNCSLIVNNVTILTLNSNIDPNKQERFEEAIFVGTLDIYANNTVIDGLCISANGKINGYTNENTVLKNILIVGSTVNANNVNSCTNLNFYAGTKNIQLLNSRIEKTSNVRGMIMYLQDVDGLVVQNCEFYGPYYSMNDGIKVTKSNFGIKGNVNISNNYFDGYAQYVIWFRYYAEGTYVVENNTIKNCGSTLASHAAVTFVEYTGDSEGLAKVTFNNNTIENVPMMFRIDASSNIDFTANYNIVTSWNQGYIQYVKVATGPIVNAEYNYWGTENVDESLFNGIAVPENIYTSIEEVQ